MVGDVETKEEIKRTIDVPWTLSDDCWKNSPTDGIRTGCSEVTKGGSFLP